MLNPVHLTRAVLPRRAAAVAITAFAVSAAVLATGLSHTTFGTYFDDLGELVLAATAAGLLAHRGIRSHGRMRWSWLSLAAGCAFYTLGEAWWSWLELGRGIYPFPSIADVGYLAFPLAVSIGMLLYPTPGGASGRGKRALDAVMTTASIVLVSWETVLAAVAHAGGETRIAFDVSLAYPISDICVLTLTVLTLSRLRNRRISLTLVAVGVISLSGADSVFAYLSASSSYDGGTIDLGWFFAFIVLALAAVSREKPTDYASRPAIRSGAAGSSSLAYAPALLAIVVTLVRAGFGHVPDGRQLLLIGIVGATLLARQYVTLRENVSLTKRLAEREEQLHHQAFHDSLTGLANRALFQDRLKHALELHARDLRAVSVLFLDLDDFKICNDTMGHAVGDELLARTAERLVGAARTGDTVARLGGDEFAVLLEDSGDPVQVAAKLTDALRAPFTVGGQQVTVTASIGVVALDAADNATTADQLLTHADTAMYAAKRSGKAQIELYRDGMSLLELAEQQLGSALATAIRTGKLRLEYQPIVDVGSGSIRALEALARWTHDGKNVPPAKFIPLATSAGLMGELTRYVLDDACAQLKAWSETLGHHELVIGVNVAPEQLVGPDFVATVAELVKRHGIAEGQLVIEITESGIFADLCAARAAIKGLREIGVRVSLDDFGVGYSSLAQLHNLQLDSVKIDQSFVNRLESDPSQVKFLRALINLGNEVGLPVLAEGIERPEQLEELRRLGCPLAQGFLFARPVPANAVLALLRTNEHEHPRVTGMVR